MTEPVFLVSHFRIKEGQLDVARQMMSEATSRLQAEKPRTALYGNPSPAAVETLRQAAASAGVLLTRHPVYVVGFLRHAAD